MKHFAISLSFVLLSLFSFSQQETTIDSLKIEAKAFSLKVVKTYFDNDFKSFYNKVSDTIFIIGGPAIPKQQVKEKLNRAFNRALLDKTKTYNDYLASYKLYILTKAELQALIKKTLPKDFMVETNGLFFLGLELKEGATNFIWDDMFGFMVRKENDEWKLKGIDD